MSTIDSGHCGALYEQTEKEKREIYARETTPGMSVAQVARRYAGNANLIFKWLKDPRFAPEADAFEQKAMFPPVEIDADVARANTVSICPSVGQPGWYHPV